MGVEESYTFRDQRPVVLLRGYAGTPTMEVSYQGTIISPDAGGTYTLRDPGGTTVKTGTITITGDVATFPLIANDLPSTLDYSYLYLAEWQLAFNGVQRIAVQQTVISPYQIHCPLAVGALTKQNPRLLTSLGNSYNSTHIQGWIDLAWADTIRRLCSEGEWPDQIVSVSSLYDPLRARTWQYICEFLGSNTKNSTYWLNKAEENKAEWETKWSGVTYLVDRDSDKAIDSNERHSPNSEVVNLNPAPQARRLSWL